MEEYSQPVSADFFAAFAGPFMLWPFYAVAGFAGLLSVARKTKSFVGWLFLASVVLPIGNYYLTHYLVDETNRVARGDALYSALKITEWVVFAPIVALVFGLAMLGLRRNKRTPSHAHS